MLLTENRIEFGTVEVMYVITVRHSGNIMLLEMCIPANQSLELTWLSCRFARFAKVATELVARAQGMGRHAAQLKH
jgi:hypothetical protein